MIRRLIVTIFLVFMALPAHAVNPDEVLSDPALEARAREISAGLRCLVCQNQSIDDSNADLAKDLRVIVRERLVAGETNEEVINYVVSRYGEFVLLKPRLSLQTVLLWGTPAILLLIGLIAIAFKVSRKRPISASGTLSDEEKAEIDRLMNE